VLVKRSEDEPMRLNAIQPDRAVCGVAEPFSGFIRAAAGIRFALKGKGSI
jgi:hypothetical protein